MLHSARRGATHVSETGGEQISVEWGTVEGSGDRSSRPVEPFEGAVDGDPIAAPVLRPGR
jgi:hypothetical protein